jgi:hypothetical protein
MSKILQCPLCNRKVPTTKDRFNWILFILSMIVFFPIGLLYAGYHANKKHDNCSICGYKFSKKEYDSAPFAYRNREGRI